MSVHEAVKVPTSRPFSHACPPAPESRHHPSSSSHISSSLPDIPVPWTVGPAVNDPHALNLNCLMITIRRYMSGDLDADVHEAVPASILRPFPHTCPSRTSSILIHHRHSQTPRERNATRHGGKARWHPRRKPQTSSPGHLGFGVRDAFGWLGLPPDLRREGGREGGKLG